MLENSLFMESLPSNSSCAEKQMQYACVLGQWYIQMRLALAQVGSEKQAEKACIWDLHPLGPTAL